MDFKDRKTELSLLNKIYARKGSQFIVLFGRRRIGKTALITHWMKNRKKENTLYWVAHKSSSMILLEKFSKAMKPCLKGISEDFRFADWETAIRQIFTTAKERKIFLAIDEFPYLLQSVPEFSSLLQEQWDKQSKEAELILLLCGSSYNMMHAEILSGKGPLYGRSTADILLEEIEPESIPRFLPRYSKNQIVETFSIIGGVPKYLEMWDDSKPVFANVQNLILSPVTIFRQEALFLIQEEISDPRTYLAILETIGNTMKSPAAISKQTGIAINHMGKYLRVLLDLGFVRRIVSLDAHDYSNTRMSRYEIKDSYLKFYFTYIYPNLELIEQHRYDRLMEMIKENYSSYVGKTGYEELARRHMIFLGDRNRLPFIPERVGRIWNPGEEIDVAAVDRKTGNVLVGECKWTNKKMNSKDLDHLMKRSATLSRVKEYKIHYALFSKSGFTSSLMKRARKENVFLFTGAGFDGD